MVMKKKKKKPKAEGTDSKVDRLQDKKKTKPPKDECYFRSDIEFLKMNEDVKDLTESNVEGYQFDLDQSLSGTWSSFNIQKYMNYR